MYTLLVKPKKKKKGKKNESEGSEKEREREREILNRIETADEWRDGTVNVTRDI